MTQLWDHRTTGNITSINKYGAGNYQTEQYLHKMMRNQLNGKSGFADTYTKVRREIKEHTAYLPRQVQLS